jgi:putative Mn2+ efflux pump MntP
MLKLLALIVPLGLDTFAASTALGAAGVAGRERLRVGLLFGAFEAGMTLLGYAVGNPLGHAAGSIGDYVAAGVLAVLGLWIVLGGEGEDRVESLTSVRGFAAVALGISVSLDELAIGLSLGVLRLSVVPVAIAVGLQALVVALVGTAVGAGLSARVREGSERLAGVALIVLAVVLVLARLLG